MKNLENMTHDELLRYVKKERKFKKINAWINIIGTSVILLILIIGLILVRIK